MGGTVDLADVFAMLDACAEGHSRSVGDHYWRVTYAGLVYPTLPTGAKSDKRKMISALHVAKMVRALRVPADCARKHLAQLAGMNLGDDPPKSK